MGNVKNEKDVSLKFVSDKLGYEELILRDQLGESFYNYKPSGDNEWVTLLVDKKDDKFDVKKKIGYHVSPKHITD